MTQPSQIHWGNIAGAALTLGLLLFGAGAWGLVRAAPTTSWPSTTGAIEESRIEYASRSDPDRAHLRYRYMVQGRTYAGERVGYMQLRSERGARNLIAQYIPGAPVLVYYDPRDPSRSVLQPGGTGTALGFLAAGLGLLACWRYALRRRSRA